VPLGGICLQQALYWFVLEMACDIDACREMWGAASAVKLGTLPFLHCVLLHCLNCNPMHDILHCKVHHI
jgi:hypothetical protein